MRNINLLPLNHRPQARFELKSFISMLLGGIVLTSLVLALLILQIRINNSRSLISTKNNNIKLLEAQVNTIEETSQIKSIDSIMKNIEEIESEITSYEGLINDIDGFRPSDMEISSLSIGQEDLGIQGQATRLNSISNFIQSLNQWELSDGVAISNITPSGDKLSFNIQVNRWRSE